MISERLFIMLDRTNYNFLTCRCFIKGLLPLYIGTLEERINYVFDFYDANGDGMIKPGDIRLFLTHCPIQAINLVNPKYIEKEGNISFEQNAIEIYLDRIQSQDELTKLIISCFHGNDMEMNREEFLKTTKNYASDLFLPLYCLLRNKLCIQKKISYLAKMNPILITSHCPQGKDGNERTNQISTSKFLSKSKFGQIIVHQSPKLIYSQEVL